MAELREIERAGPSVKQADSPEDEKRADTVSDGEVQRTFDRVRFDLVCCERIGRHAHQLEENE